MAKTRRVWNDMIGQQKTVEGYVFTIIGIDGCKVVIDFMGHQDTIERRTWDKGVFKKQLRAIKPTHTKCSTEKTKRRSKYLGQTKMINDVLFKVVEVMKNKVKVVAEGYYGCKDMVIQTWKNELFFKNIMKVLKRIVEKYELIVYDEFQRDFLGRIVKERGNEITKEFSMCDTVVEVRKLFKRYSRYLHPDMGNMMVADKYGWEWLCATRDAQIEMIEFWSDLDDDEL